MIEPDLDGQVVVVTGSAKGVGRELLLATADCGAKTAIHYNTSEDAARTVTATARERGAADTVIVQADVTDSDDVDRLFDTVENELGPVDVLVNNVGEFAPVHWTDLDYETWRQIFATNVHATYLCCRRALPAMRVQQYGRIVNVGYASSEKGMTNPKNAPYFMAKAGVLMFTRMLAGDTQDDGITVNAISPYVVENSEEFPDELPRGRPAAFEDMVQTLFFFLDEDSGYISGENVEVDGGWLPEDV